VVAGVEACRPGPGGGPGSPRRSSASGLLLAPLRSEPPNAISTSAATFTRSDSFASRNDAFSSCSDATSASAAANSSTTGHDPQITSVEVNGPALACPVPPRTGPRGRSAGSGDIVARCGPPPATPGSPNSYDKQGAAPTYKRGFGYHRLLVFCDETSEALAGKLRPGGAGANTAADHIELLDAAVAQLPVTTTADDPDAGMDVLVRADTAGATHGFVDAIVARHFEFAVGLDITEAVRLAILSIPEDGWQTPMTQQMEDRDGAGVVEITPYLDLSAWPPGTRAVCRREEPHAGAQFNLFHPDGWRHQVFITNSVDADIVYLEARHRGHARVEDHIKDVKALGLLRFPSHDFAPNAAWLLLVGIAADLQAWAQGLCLEGDLATAEPKRLRYCAWHAAGRLVRSGRRLTLRLDASWPWAGQLQAAFEWLGRLTFTT